MNDPQNSDLVRCIREVADRAAGDAEALRKLVTAFADNIYYLGEGDAVIRVSSMMFDLGAASSTPALLQD